MIKVNNKKAISNLSRKSLKSNRLRNLVAVLAIAMTAVLFTALFTVGGSMLASIQQATMRQVGTSSHAGFKFLTQEQYDILCQDPKIKDISYNIVVGFGENEELKKTYTEIRWTEPKDAEWSFTMPTTGRLPQERLELATTTSVLDALGVPHELGQKVHLEFSSNGIKYSQDFTLCGFWESDVVMGANEAYVSREYCDEVAPVINVPIYENPDADYSSLAGTINPSFWFSTSWDIGGQVDSLMQRCGFDPQYVNSGVNWAYASAEMDAQSILLLASIIIIVLLSGYLIIYNVFYISVSKDIRFYGLLKTLGTTGKQLKKIVLKQALYLCLYGIPLGLLVGWICGRLLIPAVMHSSTLGDNYVVSANPMIFAFSALFALFTVFISCIKPCRIAAKVSPIEAVRWTGVSDNVKKKERKSKKISPISMSFAGLQRERKKAVVVILSLSLSMVLLNGTYTIIKGFDMDKYLHEKVVTDFLITDASLRNGFSQCQDITGVTDTVLNEINSLPGLESMGSVWMSESVHKISDQKYDDIHDIIEKNKDKMALPYAEESLRMIEEDHTMASHIYGVDEDLWDKIELYDGNKLDTTKFASGDYVIVTGFYNNGTDRYYDIGDKVTIDFGDGVSKTYTVLDIGNIPYALGPQHSHYIDIYFTLPASEYSNNVGDTQPMTAGFDVDDENTPAAEEWVKSYCENIEPDLDYESKAVYVEQFKSNQTMFAAVGGVMSFILGLIGILNFINAVVTSILARRRELAMLQSVGMTGKQLTDMLIGEGLAYVALTLIFTVTVGSFVSYALVKLLTNQIWFFSYHFTLLPIVICVPFLILIAILIPIVSYRLVSKQSVVERLREAE
ncbi:MAG: ABC transporter permease [Candidatus Metalachnospira sp.]|nr:ABC transporter permease [Candidatus Metalachnospira sp.]